jgi:hypothetical protein
MARIRVVRNTEGTIYGGVFHPYRSGAEYDAGRLDSESAEYKRERARARLKKRKATATKKKKPAAKKKAKAKVKRKSNPRMSFSTEKAARSFARKHVGAAVIAIQRPGYKTIWQVHYSAKHPSAGNPSFPVGRFVKVEKVRVNKDGTVSILKKKGSR